MLTDTGAIRNYFARLGLETEIADIYLSLHANGPQTISQLSRNAHVERTRIYRLIDRLMESNLIEVEAREKRGTIKAAPIANLHILITQKEQELKSLQDELGLIEQVLARNSLSSPGVRVQLYNGTEGLRQMRRNIAGAKSEVISLLYKDIPDEVDLEFAQQWAKQANELPAQFRAVYNEQLRAPHQASLAKHRTAFPKLWEERYVSGRTFPITHSTVIYDDTVASFHWQHDAFFGIEMHNRDIARTQRAFFEMLWETL
jgi:sugar-specific transcriptional regulator TrmB